MDKKKIVMLAGSLLVAAGVFLYWENIANNGKYSSSNTPVTVLSQQNQDFAAGNTYQTQGNYMEALQSYQKALSQAQDASQKAVIEFRIALAAERSGNFSQAIQGFKKIVADQSSYPDSVLLRAYALQDMGYMHYQYHSGNQAQTIFDAIFSDTPYSDFKKKAGSDSGLAYRYLFEYATSFYPLAYSEARIAVWYSNNLVGSLGGATTTQAGGSNLAAVRLALQRADADVQRTKDASDTSMWIPPVLQLEGVALGQLANVGAADPTQVEAYFQQGLLWEKKEQYKPGSFTTYDYALFLAKQYGNKRVKDIQNLLSVFNSSNTSNINPSVIAYFKPAAGGASSMLSKNFALLAGLDPDFKTFLMSLGWHASDL